MASIMTVYTVTTLHDPGAITLPGGGPGSTTPQDIDNAGQIVGSYAVIWSSPMMVQSHGFLYNPNDGSYTTIDDPLAGQIGSFGGTSAQGINDVGKIVGSYTAGFPGGGVHGFLYSGGTYTTLDAPGTTNQTAAYGINNAGQIVGAYKVGSVNHGFLYDGTTYTTLDDPFAGPDGTFAYGINNQVH